MNTFIQQGCNKIIKSDSENIYNVTQDFYFKSTLFKKKNQTILSKKQQNSVLTKILKEQFTQKCINGCFFIWTILEKFNIASLAYQWVPSEWESKTVDKNITKNNPRVIHTTPVNQLMSREAKSWSTTVFNILDHVMLETGVKAGEIS